VCVCVEGSPSFYDLFMHFKIHYKTLGLGDKKGITIYVTVNGYTKVPPEKNKQTNNNNKKRKKT